jgi:hypothetical protein
MSDLSVRRDKAALSCELKKMKYVAGLPSDNRSRIELCAWRRARNSKLFLIHICRYISE